MKCEQGGGVYNPTSFMDVTQVILLLMCARCNTQSPTFSNPQNCRHYSAVSAGTELRALRLSRHHCTLCLIPALPGDINCVNGRPRSTNTSTCRTNLKRVANQEAYCQGDIFLAPQSVLFNHGESSSCPTVQQQTERVYQTVHFKSVRPAAPVLLFMTPAFLVVYGHLLTLYLSTR